MEVNRASEPIKYNIILRAGLAHALPVSSHITLDRRPSKKVTFHTS